MLPFDGAAFRLAVACSPMQGGEEERGERREARLTVNMFASHTTFQIVGVRPDGPQPAMQTLPPPIASA